MSRTTEIMSQVLLHDAKMTVKRCAKNKRPLSRAEIDYFLRQAAKYGVPAEMEAILS